jgi:hypothetical protein
MLWQHARTLLGRSRQLLRQSASPLVASTLGWTVASPVLFSLCDSGKKNPDGDKDWMANLQDFGNQIASVAGEKVQEAVDSGVPTQLSYGFVCGYCSGYALKKAGKVAAIVFGK